MKIRQLFLGVPANTSYVELQMTASGQNFVHGQTIDVYNNVNSLHSSFILPSDVANGGNQRTILIGDSGASGSPDFVIPGFGTSLLNVLSAGALCYSNIDCVSWGSFSNDAVLPSPAGVPLTGIGGPNAWIRTLARGCPTTLDEADDTNSSLSDFGMVPPAPRNNSVTPTEVPCAPVHKKKCKKKKHRSAEIAKKKCKKHKKR